MNTRRAIIGDEALLRRLRLEALALDPYALGSTFDREFARTVEDWQRWISSGVVFLLEEKRGAHGLIAGVRDTYAPVVQLMAMWVNPDARGFAGQSDRQQVAQRPIRRQGG